ncbi:MAG: hypothetical protein R3F65_30060 [bacterium]
MIGLAVWRLDGEALHPWHCERCETMGPRPHIIDPADPDAERDEMGRAFVPAYRVAPTARGAVEDARLYRCPLHAIATWCADLLQLWRVSDGELPAAMTLVGATPSAALIDAWDLLRGEIEALRGVLRRRADEAAA